MLTRRTFCKLTLATPMLVIMDVEAFWPGIVLRFIIGRTFPSIGGSIARASSRIVPEILSMASSTTKISKKALDIRSSNKEKISEFLDRLDNIVDGVDIATNLSDLVWNNEDKNSVTMILANTGNDTSSVEPTDLSLSEANGEEISKIKIPAIKINPEEGVAFQFDFNNLPPGLKTFNIKGGRAGNLYKEILVANNHDYEKISSDVKKIPPGTTASDLYKSILGN